MSDRLAGLLADFQPPPVPAGLADRVAVAALGHRQEAAAGPRPARRDRRGRWLIRPLLGATAAAGLVFSSAVAASLAGVPLPQSMQKVVDALPLVGKQVDDEPAPPAPARRVVAPQAAPPTPRPAPVAEPVPDPTPRVSAFRRHVQERRAAGLPTPGADRLEQRMERRRAAGLPVPTDQQMERILERRAAARRQRQQRMREQGLTPRQGIAPGQGIAPQRRFDPQSLTPEQRERVQDWREQRRERLQRWRELRQQRMQAPQQDF